MIKIYNIYDYERGKYYEKNSKAENEIKGVSCIFGRKNIIIVRNDFTSI